MTDTFVAHSLVCDLSLAFFTFEEIHNLSVNVFHDSDSFVIWKFLSNFHVNLLISCQIQSTRSVIIYDEPYGSSNDFSKAFLSISTVVSCHSCCSAVNTCSIHIIDNY